MANNGIQNIEEWWNSLTTEEKSTVYGRSTADTIVRLQPSDIISDSMHKINYNFDVLLNLNEVDEYKYNSAIKRLNERLDSIQRGIDSRDSELANGLTDLNDKIDNLETSIDFQSLIDEAIANVNNDLQNFITRTDFETGIDSKLGQYVRSAQLKSMVDGYGYITSAAFDEFVADASTGSAMAQRMVANAEFYKEYNSARRENCFVYLDGTVSNYATVDEYYYGIPELNIPGVKNEVDPQGKGLENEDVVKALIKKAEDNFMIIYKEVALIKQTVVEGESTLDVLTAVRGDDGEDIAAAIFMKANAAEGSSIGLTADHIQIDAAHKLALNTGTFTLNSNNFNIDANGNVTTNGLTANNINIDGITLKSKNGYTVIDSSGILYAEGAHIHGDITAENFRAQDTVNINAPSISMSGPITKTTTMNGSTFNIEAVGTLYQNGNTSSTNTKDVTNSLYIKVMDELHNDRTDIINAETLVAVPVLCMMYEGVEYTMAPGAWINPSGSGDTSNMKWIEQYDVVKYIFNKPESNASTALINLWNSRCKSGSTSSILSTPGTYYMFNPDYRVQLNTSGSTYRYGTGFVKYEGSDQYSEPSSYDTVYRFKVINWGSDPSSKISLITSGKSLSSGTTQNTINNGGAFALGNSILGEYKGSNSIVHITSTYCNTYKAYLRDSFSAGTKYMSDFSTGYTSSSTEDCSINTSTFKDGTGRTWSKNIHDFIEWAVIGVDSEVNKIWTKQDSTLQEYIITGFENNNLPFMGSGRINGYTPYSKRDEELQIRLEYYPLFTIDNYGKGLSNNVKTIWIRCYAVMSCNYDGYDNQSIRVREIDGNTSTIRTVAPSMIKLEAEFDIILDLTTGYGNYIPTMPNAKEYILDKVKTFLDNIDLTTTIGTGDYCRFTGTLETSTGETYKKTTYTDDL